MPTTPVVKAFLICDYVIHEQETNKKSCIGIFHQINASRFPCRHGQLAIYANITDALGDYAFHLSLVHLKDGKQIGTGSTPSLNIPDKLQTAELAFTLQNIVFPEPGKYEFHLMANDELIAQKSFHVLEMRRPDEPA
ncbi:MAG: DUF6941 family protein [Planctomycetota bacterium]